MEKKPTTRALVVGTVRRAMVLGIVVSVLSMQQSWAALVCHCESHNKLIANTSQAERDKEQSRSHHSACHHSASETEGAEGSHGSGDAGGESAAPDQSAIPGSPPETMNSAPDNVSCCCSAQASPPEVSTLSFSTQQVTPVETAPAGVVEAASVTTLSINIHGPPRSARSRPLYIVQSSLLI